MPPYSSWPYSARTIAAAACACFAISTFMSTAIEFPRLRGVAYPDRCRLTWLAIEAGHPVSVNHRREILLEFDLAADVAFESGSFEQRTACRLSWIVIWFLTPFSHSEQLTVADFKVESGVKIGPWGCEIPDPNAWPAPRGSRQFARFTTTGPNRPRFCIFLRFATRSASRPMPHV